MARWLGDIRTYFPSTVVEVMQRDAIDRLDLTELLLEPELLAAVEPDVHLVGTLIGLVQMLQNMSDPAAIGPAMAVALLTTFYGAVLANVLFLPMAGKLKTRSKTEILQKTVITEGMESILSGENPRIMEQKLHAYIAPRKRESVFNK